MPNASQVTQNIKRSVRDYLSGLTLTWKDGNGVAQTAPLFFGATAAQVPLDGAWVNAIWRKRTSSPMAATQRAVTWGLTLECWSRIKDDPLQANLDGLVDTLLAALRAEQADKRIPLLDYAAPANPVASGYFIQLAHAGDDHMPSTDPVYGRSVSVNVNYFERY